LPPELQSTNPNRLANSSAAITSERGITRRIVEQVSRTRVEKAEEKEA
jgi:hypothetical protein